MLYKLIRKDLTELSTIGELWRDGLRLCYTLEDTDRGLTSDRTVDFIKLKKVDRLTAIPYGIYEIKITLSNRFKRLMPQLMNVPGFEGIRIHSGNTAEQTDGCILVGRTVGHDFIGESVLALNELFPILKTDCEHGQVNIEISRDVVLPVKGVVAA